MNAYWDVVLIWNGGLIAAVLSCCISLVHFYDEVHSDGGPLWEDLGRAVGVRVPYLLGLLAFAALLGVSAKAGLEAWQNKNTTWAALLVGIRFGDTVFSHWLPWLEGRRPNAGIVSSWVCLFDGVLLVCFFHPLNLNHVYAGAAVFLAIWFAGFYYRAITRRCCCGKPNGQG